MEHKTKNNIILSNQTSTLWSNCRETSCKTCCEGFCKKEELNLEQNCSIQYEPGGSQPGASVISTLQA